MKSLFLLVTLTISFIGVAKGQLRPDELSADSYVKLVLNDSSQFYAIVLGRPLPDRILAEARYGKLEIPLTAIAYAIDYRWNWVKKDDLKRDALKNSADVAKYEVQKYLTRPKLPDISTVATKDHDIFKGNRYLFNDS